jgi:predicted amidohydrolase YtcJ
MDPLLGIYTAITRQTRVGTPDDGWFPANRITLEAALLHYTRDAAYASFDELDKGTISVGKYADFVVLSRDILTGPPQQLLDTQVLLTVMSGRETYRAQRLTDGTEVEPAR